MGPFLIACICIGIDVQEVMDSTGYDSLNLVCTVSILSIVSLVNLQRHIIAVSGEGCTLKQQYGGTYEVAQMMAKLKIQAEGSLGFCTL